MDFHMILLNLQHLFFDLWLCCFGHLYGSKPRSTATFKVKNVEAHLAACMFRWGLNRESPQTTRANGLEMLSCQSALSHLASNFFNNQYSTLQKLIAMWLSCCLAADVFGRFNLPQLRFTKSHEGYAYMSSKHASRVLGAAGETSVFSGTKVLWYHPTSKTIQELACDSGTQWK